MADLSYISPKAAIRTSVIHGKGLFAVTAITRGEIVCVKGGHIFSRDALRRMPPWYRAAEVQIAEDLFIGPMEESEREGSMIYSNHSCDPNIGVRGEIVFVAMRDIAAGEELTHDWATTDDDDHEMTCNCGSDLCRKIVTGRDWLRPDLQAKYRGHFSPFLQARIDALE